MSNKGNKVDWSKAPQDAEFYAMTSFRKLSADECLFWSLSEEKWCSGGFSLNFCLSSDDYEERPKQTPKQQTQENETMLSEAQLEAQVVKEWITKAIWLHNNTEISFQVYVDNEHGEPYYNQDCVDFIIGSYASYKVKEDEKNKQLLLDKKAKLELELAEINKQLGE